MNRPATLSLLLLVCLAACDDDRRRQPPGGAGGSGGISGGEGGAGGSLDELCERACDVLAPCEAKEARACISTCLGAPAPAPAFVPCVACLESVDSCEGARLACQHGVACDMAWDLRVEGQGLSAFDGRTARILVAEAVPGEQWVDFFREVVIEDGAFSVEMVGALPSWGIPFDVVVAIDGDGDGACTSDGLDAAWHRSVGVPTGDARIVIHGGDPRSSDALAYWGAALPEIVLEGAGLRAFDGRYVIAAPVWTDPTFLTVGSFVTARIEHGAFRVGLQDFGDYVEEMAPESEIRAAWMIDLDGDWICSDADAGGSGRVPPKDVLVRSVAAGPTTPGTAPCELLRGLGHDVLLEGGGWDRHEGVQVEAALVDEAERVVAFARGRVEDGSLRLRFDDVAVPGRNYAAAIWVDVDGGWSCEIPPDEVRLVPLGEVQGDIVRAIPYVDAAGDVALCEHFRTRR